MNDITGIILQHFSRYPQMQLQDLVKLAYQNEYGCGHLINNPQGNFHTLKQEWNSVIASPNIPLLEDIGNGFVRLNLAAARQDGLTADIVHQLLIMSASQPAGNAQEFKRNLTLLRTLCRDSKLPFTLAEFDALKQKYDTHGYNLIRHTEQYRTLYKPAYRVIRQENFRYIPLLSAINALMAKKQPVIIAIDGKCASGKTTLANLLSAIYDTVVIHMDDFFLPAELRTKERYAQPGGNIHYERFLEEVSAGIKGGNAFSYRIFDCTKMNYNETAVISPSSLVIIEGSYSLKPEFRDLYDFKILMDISPEEQKRRIKIRNSEEKYRQFIERWIPLEECYFKECEIMQCCDFII